MGHILPSIPQSGIRPNLPMLSPMWDAPHMEKGEKSQLQIAVRRAIEDSGRPRDALDRELQKRLGTKGKPLYDIERGKSRNPKRDHLEAIADVLGKPVSYFLSGSDQAAMPASLDDISAEYGIAFLEELDLALGMGASFLDGHPEVRGIVPFKLDWLHGLHEGPLDRLKVVRGRGDSMQPTIWDGDIVLVDTAQRRIDDQDRIWAVAYGELGMIRRVRVTPRGTWMLMPDNTVVRPDEVGDGEVAVIGRVIWIGRRF